MNKEYRKYRVVVKSEFCSGLAGKYVRLKFIMKVYLKTLYFGDVPGKPGFRLQRSSKEKLFAPDFRNGCLKPKTER